MLSGLDVTGILELAALLIAGGIDNSVQILASAELYDPASGKFSSAGSMAVSVYAHTATRLTDGSVLIAGGDNDSGPQAAAELYRP